MKKPMALPPQSELTRIFRYDAMTGNLTRQWRDDLDLRANRRFANKISGSVSQTGHLVVSIDKKRYLAHRVIWKMLYNSEPQEIDHANGNPSDNRAVNLRAVTHQQNLRNRIGKLRKSLPKGVHVAKNKFAAKIGIDGHSVHLGTFNNPEDDSAAYRSAAQKTFGEHARLA